MRVAFVPRSAEIKPWFWRFVLMHFSSLFSLFFLLFFSLSLSLSFLSSFLLESPFLTSVVAFLFSLSFSFSL